jgi:fatty-acyl-CoA synthase
MDIVRKAISHALDDIVRQYPDNDALIHTDAAVRYTYSLLSWEVERAARGMVRLGIENGDRVGLWAANLPEWIIAQMALIRIGAVYVPLDPAAGPEDVSFILGQSDARAVIMARGLEEQEQLETLLNVKGQLPSLENVILLSAESHPEAVLWSEVLAMGEDLDPRLLREREMEIDPLDPVAIMYTSGTTGTPKGVVLDHLGLLNKSLFSAERQGLTPKDRLCLFFPLFHMFGNTCIALTGLLTGSALVMPCSSFDPEKILGAIFKEKCTGIYGSPSMIAALLEHPNFNKKRWQTVTKGIIGGAVCPAELMKKVVMGVGVSGITNGYGITETSSWITMTHPRDPLEKKISTIGRPLECNEVKIIDPASGEDLPCDSQGELCIRGLLMKSYFKMPGATAKAIDKEGWFHSGDLGEVDAKGYFKITGRIKDIIVKEGVEIHPSEIEEVIYDLPGIMEVQVFGFLHPMKGQEMAAWIKLKPGVSLREEDVFGFLKRKLDGKKLPDHVKFVSEYPKTPSGKVQKRKLAEMAQKEYCRNG